MVERKWRLLRLVDPDQVIGFSVHLILLAALKPWRSTQPLPELSTTYLPGSNAQPALKADKLTAIYGPIA
jgi:hypothetical protein